MELFAVWPRWELCSTLFPTKSHLLPYHLRFFLLCLCLGWKVFSSTIAMIFRFSSHISSSSSRDFSSIDSFVRFPSPVFLIGLGGFSPVTWSFKTHQLFYGVKMFSLVSRFSSPVSHWVGRVFTKLHSYLHLYVRRSSCLRGKTIVISWSRNLQITGCTSSSLPPL